jgi:hypothetical protein
MAHNHARWRGDPGARDAAWRELAANKPDVADAGLLEASRAADKLPEQVETNLDRRVTAAEKADAYAKQMYDMFKERLPEEERQRLEDLIKTLDDEARGPQGSRSSAAAPACSGRALMADRRKDCIDEILEAIGRKLKRSDIEEHVEKIDAAPRTMSPTAWRAPRRCAAPPKRR